MDRTAQKTLEGIGWGECEERSNTPRAGTSAKLALVSPECLEEEALSKGDDFIASGSLKGYNAKGVLITPQIVWQHQVAHGAPTIFHLQVGLELLQMNHGCPRARSREESGIASHKGPSLITRNHGGQLWHGSTGLCRKRKNLLL